MTTALLVMDMQNGVVDRFAERSTSLLATLAQTVAAARAASIPVLFVRVAFRDGAPEANARNQSFSVLAKSDTMSENSPATQIHPGVAPLVGEIMITKRRVSAFSGSDLDVLARSVSMHWC